MSFLVPRWRGQGVESSFSFNRQLQTANRKPITVLTVKRFSIPFNWLKNSLDYISIN
jgi:hypothetical protein